MSRPDVLLVVWDTCRRDALEPYGAPAGTTPVAADLARRGVAAPGAHATSSWTMPSHASLLSGLLPRELGLTQAPGGTVESCRPALEAAGDRLLPAVLRRAGYATRASSANLWVAPAGGFGAGFERFETVGTHRIGVLGTGGARARLRWDLQAVRARADDGAGRQRETVLGWLGEPGTGPRLHFVNLNECHSPYLPPRPFASLGPVGRLRAAEDARRWLGLGELWRACAGGALPPPDALERMRTLYADSVRQCDAWLGDVLEALDRAGRLDETLVVLTADHGENFGEGHYMAHAFSLDQRLCHVPLVAAGPGAERLADVASLADLPRRLAEIAGVADHPYAERPDAVAQFDPPGGADDPRFAELAESWPDVGREQIAHRLAKPLTAAVHPDGRHKLVRRGPVEEFHDLVADPDETRPVGAGELPGGVVGELRRIVAGAARGAGEARPTAPTPADVGDLEERMRMLGYL